MAISLFLEPAARRLQVLSDTARELAAKDEAIPVGLLQAGEMVEIYDEKGKFLFSILRLREEQLMSNSKYLDPSHHLDYLVKFANGYSILLPKEFSFEKEKLITVGDDELQATTLETLQGVPNFHIAKGELKIDLNTSYIATEYKHPSRGPDAFQSTLGGPKYFPGKQGPPDVMNIKSDGLEILAFTALGIGKTKYRYNQDSIGLLRLKDGTWRMVVCDGLGGHPRGEVASWVAVETFLDPDKTLEQVCEEVRRRIKFLNLHQTAHHRDFAVTTFVAAEIQNGNVVIERAGDSDFFLVNRSEITGTILFPDRPENMPLRKAPVDLTPTSATSRVPIDGTFGLASDGASRTWTPKDVVVAGRKPTLYGMNHALAGTIAALNNQVTIQWILMDKEGNAQSFEETQAKDNVSFILVRRTSLARIKAKVDSFFQKALPGKAGK